MTRDELARASDLLESAAESADSDDDTGRLSDLAAQLDELAAADRGPDHGRLARLENALNELRDRTSGDAFEELTAAHARIKEYRSGVEGV